MPEIIQSKHIYTLAHVNSHLLHFAASWNNYFSIWTLLEFDITVSGLDVKQRNRSTGVKNINEK